MSPGKTIDAQQPGSSAADARRPLICIVDDDDQMRRLLRNVLERANFRIVEATNEAGLQRALNAHAVDLITLDLTLRDEDGLEIARHVRTFSDVPIIMVTARAEDIDRIIGLELGADDYIVKPFNSREVVARIRAVLRRINGRRANDLKPAAKSLAFGDWLVDVDAQELRTRNGQVCPLTSAEFKLLEAFLRHAGRVLSRDFLIDVIGGIDAEPLERSVDTTVSRLRKKIESDASSPRFIKTVRGSGYRFTAAISR